MKTSREVKCRAGYGLFLCAALAATSCDSPTSPTRRAPPAVPSPVTAVVPVPEPAPPPGPPAAVLTVKEFALDGDRWALVPRIRVAESGGLSGAVIESIAFNLAEADPWPAPVTWWTRQSISVGGSAQITPGIGPYGDPEWSFSVDAQYGGKVSAVIAFTDEQGRRGTVTAVAPLPR